MTTTASRTTSAAPPVVRPRRRLKPWNMLLWVGAAVVAAAVLTPIVYLVIGAFHRDTDGGMTGGGLSLANLHAVYGSTKYLRPLGNSVLLGALVALCSTVLGGVLAWICERTDVPFRRLFAVLIPIPIFISPLLTSLAWVALAAPRAGFLNASVHAVVPSINSVMTIYSMQGVVMVLTLHLTPYAYLAIRAALSTIDPSLEEASTTLGVSKLATAWRMTLPLVRPAIITSALLIFVFAIEDFSAPSLLGTPAGFTTIPSEVYFDVARGGTVGEAAMAGSLLLWLAVLGLSLQRRVIARTARYGSIGGKPSGRRVIALGPWRYLAAGVSLLYVLMALIGPYCALVYGSFLRFVTPHINRRNMTLDNFRRMISVDNIDALQHTLVLAFVGSTAALIIYLFVAFVLARTHMYGRRLLDYTSILPFALPGIVIGIGLLWAFVSLPQLGIYGTVLGLAVAYAVRYMGLGVQQIKGAFVQITPDLEGSASTLGASRFVVFRTITLPLLARSIRAVWTTLVVLFSLEISATILLYTPSSRTLPVLIWNEVQEDPPAAFAIASVELTAIFVVLALSRAFVRQSSDSFSAG